jgi:hypothetical protein
VHRVLSALAVLVLAGCSEKAGVVASDAGVADVQEGGTDADWVCPGHIDPCPEPNCYPSLTIRTSDGSLSILSARASTDSCLPALGLFADGGVQGVARVPVYGTSLCPTSACTVQVTLKDGRNIEVVAEITHTLPFPYQHCLRNTDCCNRSEYTEGMAITCFWSPDEFEIEMVAAGSDGGSLD